MSFRRSLFFSAWLISSILAGSFAFLWLRDGDSVLAAKTYEMVLLMTPLLALYFLSMVALVSW